MSSKRLKRTVSVLLCILLCVFAASSSFGAIAAESAAIVSFTVDGGASDESIDVVNWWKNDNNGKYYLFVPSTTELSALTVTFEAGADVYIGEKKLVSGEVTDAFSNEGEYKLTCGDSSYNVVVLHSDKVPAMYITTQSGSLDNVLANKNNKEPGEALIVANGETVYDGALDYIKGRGNSTWGLAKKPFNIKLSKKTNLFDMGKAKAWCLIASYDEESLIRNKGIYDLAEAVGLYYSSKSQHVDLYINNEYMGNYLLTEKVEVGSTRVDITDLDELNEEANPDIDIEECELAGTRGADSAYTFGSKKWVDIPNNPEDISGGYLLEYEQSNRYAPEVSGFITSRGQAMIFKTPEYASKAEVDYISAYYQEFEDAVYSADGYNTFGKYYTDYIDVDTMARMYVLQELAKNLDAGNTSFYLAKDAGSDLFCASPVWDFDYSLGKEFIRNDVDFSDPNGFWARINQVPNIRANSMFDSIYQSGTMNILAALCLHDDFLNNVADAWQSVFVPELDGLADKWTSLSENIYSSAVMESVRWNKFDTFDPEQAGEAYKAEVAAVTDFLVKRADFLSKNLVKDALYVRYDANGGTGCVIDPYGYSKNDITTVQKNTYVYEGKVFEGWNSEPDGSGYSYSEGKYIQVRKSVKLYAQWRDSTIFEKINLKFTQFIKELLNKLYNIIFGVKANLTWAK